MKCIHNNIKTLRVRYNLTQDDLAIKIDTKRHNIAQWEIGRATPNVDYLLKLCSLFEISITDMISVEINESYFNKLEEAPGMYYDAHSKTEKNLILFLQEELKEKNRIIKALLDIIKKENINYGNLVYDSAD